MDSYERVHEHLASLGLDVVEKTIDNYLENARDQGVMEILDHLLSEEVKSKRSKRYETKLKYAGFPFRKTMEEFDFSFQPSMDKSVVNDLMTLRFIHNRENLAFPGPSRCREDPPLSCHRHARSPVGHIRVLCVSGETCPGIEEGVHEGYPEYLSPEICKVSPDDHR